jgi:hypothetical protein
MMDAEDSATKTSDQLSKRKFLPWTNRICGGPDVHGTSLCASEADAHGLRSCLCNPPPDQNYLLCYQLVKMVYEKKLHICDRDVGNAWMLLASAFCSLPYLAEFDQIQGPAAKKSFLGLVRKAKAALLEKPAEDPFTPYERLMKTIIEEMEVFMKQKSDLMAQKRIYEAEKLESLKQVS